MISVSCHLPHWFHTLVPRSLLTFMVCWAQTSAEPDADGGMPRLVDIADDRLAVRVPNAADDASNYVLGEVLTGCDAQMLQSTMLQML